MGTETFPSPPDYISLGDYPSSTIKSNSHSVEEVHRKFIAYLKTKARDNLIIDDILKLSGIRMQCRSWPQSFFLCLEQQGPRMNSTDRTGESCIVPTYRIVETIVMAPSGERA